jgi:hypothetical protein
MARRVPQRQPGGGELAAVRGEHALGREVPVESSERQVWPRRAWLGRRSRLRRWLPEQRSTARPRSGHRRLPGRSRLPRPHQRPAATGRHAPWPAAQPPGARRRAGGVPAWIASAGTARRRPGEPPLGEAGRRDAVLVGRPPEATARAGPAGRPRPGQRAPPTAGGQPGPPDGGGDHDVERASGSPERLSNAPTCAAGREFPRSRCRLRPDGSRAAGRRRRPAAAPTARPRGPGGPAGPGGPWVRARRHVVRPGRTGPGLRAGFGRMGRPGSAQ